MKLKKWEEDAIANLRKLDALQRNHCLFEIICAVAANEITQKISGLKKVEPVHQYRVTQAYGRVPARRHLAALRSGLDRRDD